MEKLKSGYLSTDAEESIDYILNLYEKTRSDEKVLGKDKFEFFKKVLIEGGGFSEDSFQRVNPENLDATFFREVMDRCPKNVKLAHEKNKQEEIEQEEIEQEEIEKESHPRKIPSSFGEAFVADMEDITVFIKAKVAAIVDMDAVKKYTMFLVKVYSLAGALLITEGEFIKKLEDGQRIDEFSKVFRDFSRSEPAANWANHALGEEARKGKIRDCFKNLYSLYMKALVMTESSCEENSESPTAAVGLFQMKVGSSGPFGNSVLVEKALRVGLFKELGNKFYEFKKYTKFDKNGGRDGWNRDQLDQFLRQASPEFKQAFLARQKEIFMTPDQARWSAQIYLDLLTQQVGSTLKDKNLHASAETKQVLAVMAYNMGAGNLRRVLGALQRSEQPKDHKEIRIPKILAFLENPTTEIQDLIRKNLEEYYQGDEYKKKGSEWRAQRVDKFVKSFSSEKHREVLEYVQRFMSMYEQLYKQSVGLVQ